MEKQKNLLTSENETLMRNQVLLTEDKATLAKKHKDLVEVLEKYKVIMKEQSEKAMKVHNEDALIYLSNE